MKPAIRTKINRTTATALSHLLLLAGSLIMVIPLVWMISTSFKPSEDILNWPPQLIPRRVSTEHYVEVLTDRYFPRYFLNSIAVTGLGTISVIIISSITGYVFAKFRFFGKGIVFAFLLASCMVPFQVYMVPLYITMLKLKWVNTYMGIVAPALVSSFGIFFMRQNISGIPNDLIDAGRIDGLSEFRIYARVIMPLSKGPLGALTIFIFMNLWAYFIWPLIITNSREKYVLELGMAMFQRMYYVRFGVSMAGATLIIMPVIVVFFILRRNIIRGMTLTGLKF